MEDDVAQAVLRKYDCTNVQQLPFRRAFGALFRRGEPCYAAHRTHCFRRGLLGFSRGELGGTVPTHEIWKDMFVLGLPLLEKILRPVIVYIFLVILSLIHISEPTRP